MASDIWVGSVNVGVVPDARNWNNDLRRQLVPGADSVGREYGNSMGKGITRELGDAGDKSGGAFSRNFKRRIEETLKTLPDVEIDADSSDADVKLHKIRLLLDEMAHRTIGVDLEADKAMAVLGVIDAELLKIHNDAKNIDVRFDTKVARAQLALLKHEAGTAGTKGGFIRNLFSMAPQVGGIPEGGAPAGGAGGGVGTVALVGGAVAAVAAASPFIAQVISGAVVSGFGLGLAGVAIAGAVQFKAVRDAFTKVKDDFKKDLGEIGRAFVPVLVGIAGTIRRVLGAMTPVFRTAAQIIAAPFKLFSETLIKTFTSPVVKASIEAVATAFGLILRAITPQLSGMVNSIAQGITDIANAISDNPGAFAAFINFLFRTVGAGLEFIAWLTRAATYIERHWFPVIEEWIPKIHKFLQPLIDAYQRILPLVVQMLGQFWQVVKALAPVLGALADVLIKAVAFAIQDIIAPAIQYVLLPLLRAIVSAAQWVRDHWRSIFHEIAVIFDGFRHEAAHIWSIIYNDTIAKTIQFGHDIEAWFNRIVGWIKDIWNGAKRVVSGIWNGIKAAWDVVWGALKRGFLTFIRDGILTPLGWIVNGAAKAFGWMPGIGPKLRTAASQFNEFKNSVNNSLAGIKDQTVNVSVKMTAATNPYPGGISGRAAQGMYIGSGSGPTSDDVIIAASRGELVVPTWIVNSGAVDHLRGYIPGFAAGGTVGGFGINVLKPTPTQVGKSLWAQTVSVVQKAWKSAMSTVGFSGFGYAGGAAAFGTAAAAQAFAKSILWAYGWGMNQWPALLALWNQESGWNPYAVNPSSGAYGIPQSLGHGHPYDLGDYANQVRWGLAYISGRYGSPAAAWAHEVANNWYDQGGWLMPGATLAYNMTGQPELILTQSQLQAMAYTRARGSDGPVYHAHFDGLTGAAIESHVQTAFRTMSITEGALSRQGRRS